jgi:2-oxoglutarate ferredoxin oxidoreductase subunit alpha
MSGGMAGLRLVMGNEAVALGALAAGCDFYAGYPITPASEVLEAMARLLPPRGGVFLQMEDELGALAAVIGAAWGGARAMTATSGPGFSLMQEHIGYAAMTQTPCVVVDVQRGGPSTGLPTLPSQGDAMQARWGSHGDRPAIVLTAASVRGAYDTMVWAFGLAEAHRQPVVVLLDAVVAHMREPVDLPPPPAPRPRVLTPSAEPSFGDHPFTPFGSGRPVVVTGLSHDDEGLPRTGSARASERMLREAAARLAADPALGGLTAYRLEDARVAILSYGVTARVARATVDALRGAGLPVGALELTVLWPFPEPQVADLASRVDAILVPELNLGQMVMPVSAAVAGRCRVESLGRADGSLFRPDELAEAVRRMAEDGQAGRGRRLA